MVIRLLHALVPVVSVKIRCYRKASIAKTVYWWNKFAEVLIPNVKKQKAGSTKKVKARNLRIRRGLKTVSKRNTIQLKVPVLPKELGKHNYFYTEHLVETPRMDDHFSS